MSVTDEAGQSRTEILVSNSGYCLDTSVHDSWSVLKYLSSHMTTNCPKCLFPNEESHRFCFYCHIYWKQFKNKWDIKTHLSKKKTQNVLALICRFKNSKHILENKNQSQLRVSLQTKWSDKKCWFPNFGRRKKLPKIWC